MEPAARSRTTGDATLTSTNFAALGAGSGGDSSAHGSGYAYRCLREFFGLVCS
ncbi:hypothetical protein ACP4OV_014336 [Aristida adscensionis]